MRLLLTVLATVGIATSAAAQDIKWGGFAGLNMNEFDTDSASFDAEMGFEFGAQAHIDWMGWTWRTGAGLVQRNSSIEAAGSTTDYEVMYLQVPATLLWSVNEMWHLFGGLALNLAVSDDLPDGTDAESMVLTLPIGVQFAINDMHRVEAQYELGLGDVLDASGTTADLASAMGVRYVYMW